MPIGLHFNHAGHSKISTFRYTYYKLLIHGVLTTLRRNIYIDFGGKNWDVPVHTGYGLLTLTHNSIPKP